MHIKTNFKVYCQTPRGFDSEIIIDKAFLGSCCGVGLRRRSNADLHVVFVFLGEDDGNWFHSDGVFSTFWIDDFSEVWERAQKWIKNNCIHEPTGGWRFKQ